jgi:hypothetical protein
MLQIDFGDPFTSMILTFNPVPLALCAVRFVAAGSIAQSPLFNIALIAIIPPLSTLITGVAANGFCYSTGKYPFTVSNGLKMHFLARQLMIDHFL